MTFARDVAKIMGKAAAADTISSDGTAAGGAGAINTYTDTSHSAFLDTIDKSSLNDGQIVFLKNVPSHAAYVYSDSDDEFYMIDLTTNDLLNSKYQGQFKAYVMGGERGPNSEDRRVYRYPFASEASQGNIGSMSSGHPQGTGFHSSTHAYCAFGTPYPSNFPVYEKISISSDTVSANGWSVSFSSNPPNSWGTENTCGWSNMVDGVSYAKHGNISTNFYYFPHASDATFSNSPAPASWPSASRRVGAVTADTKGYTVGGFSPPNTYGNHIYSFPFASLNNVSDHGDLTVAKFWVVGASSAEHGYAMAGWTGSAQNTIEKWTHASSANATDVGDLTQNSRGNGAPASSTTSGYMAGYWDQNANVTSTIQKFSFSSDGNATGVAGLGETGSQANGAHV